MKQLSVISWSLVFFADVEVILAESFEVLALALEALHEDVKPIGLQVYWNKTKVQVFGGVLNETAVYYFVWRGH